MGDKSIQKKQYIIDVAAKVFAEMGYKNVTMKDVVEACEISRGGLYLYYESTAQLFIDVMKSQAEAGGDFTSLISDDATAADILLLFLQEEKKELFAELQKPDNTERIEEEYGDLLFALAAYGIYIGVNPDDALEKTDKKFRERFAHVEQRAREQGKGVQHLTLDEMMAYWKEAK